ncbi:mitogen-activated protein kinase 13 [Anaeramoeba flamelloides]|uniref:Mitogen-activated protein kinase n=1 Tax=Anaeramoeba flamelloides TaxID=1746091 RepID=A0ABQ8YJG8_9EUKA|nr:mitogen-activated protein kinase 13 [Anaeramoeba flamelloides]
MSNTKVLTPKEVLPTPNSDNYFSQSPTSSSYSDSSENSSTSSEDSESESYSESTSDSSEASSSSTSKDESDSSQENSESKESGEGSDLTQNQEIKELGNLISFPVSGTEFVIDQKYKYMKKIGQGAYGIVISAKDTTTKDKVAIKKIIGVFDRLTDAKRTLREIKLLKHFNHENILCLKDVMIPPVKEKFTSVYLVTELLATDLRQIINSEQELSEDHVRYFLYQILCALKYLHSGNVIHRDLKPGNILLNENCDLKVCDFGLARISDPEEENPLLTQYVATRWYRSPEIILGWGEYTSSVDVWSAGCIFGEILNRSPLFPGKDFLDQLELITKIVGKPSKKEINTLQNKRARRYMKNLPNKKKADYSKIFYNASEEALDLLNKMLQFNPQKRISVDDALNHPFLEPIFDNDDIQLCKENFNFSFEKDKLTKRKLRKLIYDEIVEFANNKEISKNDDL